jgi:predicted transcriptional regulator
VRYVSRMDVIKGILLRLNRHNETEGGIRHGENISQEQTDEYLGPLLRSNLVVLGESGVYSITPSGAALLEKWDEIDSAIVKGWREDASPRRRSAEPIESVKQSSRKATGDGRRGEGRNAVFTLVSVLSIFLILSVPLSSFIIAIYPAAPPLPPVSQSTTNFATPATALSTITSTSEVQNLSELVGGPGEAWTLALSNHTEPSQLTTLTAAWKSYFSQPDFQANKAKFHWNIIRLSFCFADTCGATPYSLDVHSTNGSTPDLSWLDAVIDICNQNGLKVMLAEFTFTGTLPNSTSEASTFMADWGLLAQHEAGNPGIAVYQIANEIADSSFVNSNYASLGGFLAHVTSAIRTYEPNRVVAWSEGFDGGLALYQGISNSGLSNIYADNHYSSYGYNSSREFESCVDPQTKVGSWVSDGNAYEVRTLNGEINAQGVPGEPMVNGHPICDAQASQWITQMMTHQIPYILWDFSQYRSNWDYILNSTSFVRAINT